MDEHEQEPAHDGLRLVTSNDDVAVSLTFCERLGWEKIVVGRKKLAAWGHSRDDVDRKTGRPTWKQLTFDRDVDRYTETVTIKLQARSSSRRTAWAKGNASGDRPTDRSCPVYGSTAMTLLRKIKMLQSIQKPTLAMLAVCSSGGATRRTIQNGLTRS
jgi:hypothetical protein